MTDLLTTSQLADRLGLAASTVRKYAQDGMPPAGHTPDGARLWDEDACRAWLAEHVLDTGHGGRREGAGRKPGSAHSSEPAKPWHARQSGAPSMTQQEYNKARAIKETAIANMKVIELRKMKGELMVAEDARAAWSEALGNIRRAIDELPKAVAQKVAAELELDKAEWDVVREIVEAEVDAVREKIRRDEFKSDG